MRRLLTLLFLLLPATALAQYAPPPPPPSYPPPGYPPPYQPPPPPPSYYPPQPTYYPAPRVVPAERLTGFELGLRASWMGPFGELEGGSNGADQADVFSDQFGLTLDIGARVIPQLFLGGYLGFGVGGGGNCIDGFGCTATTVHLGLEAILHLAPGRRLDPWIGYGLGVESAHVDNSNDFSDPDGGVTFTGFEFAHFMAGVDFRVGRGLAVGPFVDVSLSRYTSASLTSDGVDQADFTLDNPSTHGWIQVGFRATGLP